MRRFAFPVLLSVLGVFTGFVVLWKGGKSLEATWLLAACAFVVTLLAAAVPLEKRARTSSVVPVLLFVGLLGSIVSFAYSRTQNYGLDELLRDGSLLAIAAALLPICSQKKFSDECLHRIAPVVVWSAVVATLIGYGIYVLQPVNRFVGTFFDYRFHTDYWPNAWAEFLLVAWPLSFIVGKKNNLSLPRPLLMGVLLSGLLLSYSRGSLLAFFGQVLLLLFGLGMVRGMKMRSFAAAVALSVAAVLVGAGLFFSANGARSVFHDVQSVEEKLTFTAAEGTSSIDERSAFWSQAAEMIRQRPLFGHGPYSFRFVQPSMQQGILATSDHPHNVFLKIGAERGLPVLLAVLIAVGVLYAAAIRSLLRGTFTVVDTALLTSVTGVLLHNMIDYNLQFVGIALPFTLVTMLLSARVSLGWAVGRHVLQFPAFIIASLCLAVVLRETPLLIESSRGRHAEVAGNYAQAATHYARSIGQWFPRDLLLSLTGVQTASHDLVGAQQSLMLYREQNSVDPRQFAVAGFLHLSLRNPEAALGDFSLAFKGAAWNDASVLRGIVLVLRDLRRPALNREWEGPIFSLFEQYVRAVGFNTHFIALSKNVEEISQAMAIAEQVYPERKPELRALASRLDREAAEERGRLDARPQGLLW